MTDTPEVAVVTVAYTAKMDLLVRQSTALAADPAIREWVVVANGNGDLIRAVLVRFARAPRLVELESNTGSAVGFGSGIAAALSEPGNRYLLLLDEDNLPETDTVTRLLAALRGEEASRGAAGRVAIAAHRPHLYASQAARGIDVRPWDSSIGSHMADLPAKVFRRLLPRALPPSARVSPPAQACFDPSFAA